MKRWSYKLNGNLRCPTKDDLRKQANDKSEWIQTKATITTSYQPMMTFFNQQRPFWANQSQPSKSQPTTTYRTPTSDNPSYANQRWPIVRQPTTTHRMPTNDDPPFANQRRPSVRQPTTTYRTPTNDDPYANQRQPIVRQTTTTYRTPTNDDPSYANRRPSRANHWRPIARQPTTTIKSSQSWRPSYASYRRQTLRMASWVRIVNKLILAWCGLWNENKQQKSLLGLKLKCIEFNFREKVLNNSHISTKIYDKTTFFNLFYFLIKKSQLTPQVL
jgi:hypothetical protein